MRCATAFFLCALALLFPYAPVHAQKQFGFDNRKASGQPYLDPQETVKRFQVQPGYEVTLFAGEPDVINPVAFTVDERGRLWVVENFEYPQRTPPGQKPRDRIRVLEDTDGDGRVDRSTVWADGQTMPIGWDLATGIEIGHGGVFLGAPPYLFFLRDTDGDGKCDKQEILLKGFGSQDTHETLNTFQWGPDSKLYGLHGVFTNSVVEGIKMNAAVWRYSPQAPGGKGQVEGTFDIFAEGTSNPWGMDFDSQGQCFLACCVIPHLFHMVPGGTYKRQAGSSFNPYAYGLLNEICDHIHHKESGWAHAGLLYLDGSHVPEPLRGSLIMGSIHGCSIKRDTLRPNGSTYIGGHANDFLVSGDKNVRPINLRWGPDGSIYLIDWHDQNPCHQAPKESWDKERGRIYRIQRTQAARTQREGPVDLAKKSSKELVALLTHDIPYQYRTALRLLNERRDRAIGGELRNLAFKSENAIHALRGLWGMYAIGIFDDQAALDALSSANPWLRYWGVRFAGEAGEVSAKVLERLTELARTEPTPQVRLQLASTCQQLKKQDVLPILHHLLTHKEDARDACLPLLIWLALEPRVQTGAGGATLDWLRDNAAGNALVTDHIVPRTMRRLVAEDRPENLQACVAFLAGVQDSAVRRRALEGLTEALKNRQVDPPSSWKSAFANLLKDNDTGVQDLARRLAVNFQDPQAIARALTLAVSTEATTAVRLEALRDIALSRPARGLQVLQQLLRDEKSPELLCEVCRALASYDQPEIAGTVLGEWKQLPPAVRSEAVNLLAARKAWASELLTAVGKGNVPRTDLNDNAILRISTFKDAALNEQVEKVWGRFRPTPAELETLIAKMRDYLHTPLTTGGSAVGTAGNSFERGRKVFDHQCAKCHKFDGRGATVGPNLDGAGRDIEYLLTNILDPNRVIGQPYFVHLVELKDGRIEQGILAAEDNRSITLKAENDVVKVIQRKDIEGKILSQPKSIMPEGLANNMTAQDFRDLLRYVMAHPFLTHVTTAGPFPNDRLPADSSIDWREVAAGLTGRIPLPPGKAGAAVLVAMEIVAPHAMNTQLQLGAAQPLQVFLNGKLAYKGTPGSTPVLPDQAAVAIQLMEGRNQLRFVVSCRDAESVLYVRPLDPERKLRHGP